jgi:hypothetical protein
MSSPRAGAPSTGSKRGRSGGIDENDFQLHDSGATESAGRLRLGSFGEAAVEAEEPAAMKNILLASALAIAIASACYTGPDIGTPGATPTPRAATSPSEPAPVEANGLPCEIATIIEKRCVSCHGSLPRSGAKSTIRSREDLRADWEGRPLGVVSLERMRDAASPMPPEGLLAEADVTTFAKWVEGGMAEGTCGAVTSPPPAAPTLRCTSSHTWTKDDDDGDVLMTPGQACINCHTQENLEHEFKKLEQDDDDEHDDDDDGHELEAPAFTAAGTVYPTLYEPDNCYGLNAAGTQVVIEGADGAKQTLTVNRAGNFMTELPIALPYRASVVRNGKVRAMKATQTDGDCNGCHTAAGGDAPGRIVAP